MVKILIKFLYSIKKKNEHFTRSSATRIKISLRVKSTVPR